MWELKGMEMLALDKFACSALSLFTCRAAPLGSAREVLLVKQNGNVRDTEGQMSRGRE